MKNNLLRIFICVGVGLIMINYGMKSDIWGILWAAVGVLVIIYAFAPGMAKAIINAITRIVTAPFRR